MIRISNETRIGILAILSILLAIWGFLYLKGRNVLSSSKTFYVKYERVDGLLPSSPVFISGLQVGTVKALEIDPADDRTIIATLSVERFADVPKTAIAQIVSSSLMGGKSVEITFDRPCSGSDCAASGSYLNGLSKNFLQSMIGSPSELDGYVSKLQTGLISVYDSIADPNDPQGVGRMLLNFESTMANMAKITASMNALMAATTGNLTATTANLNAITGNIKSSNAEIKSMLANADAFSGQLKNAGLDKTTGKANGAIDSLTATISGIKTTLAGVDRAIFDLDNILKGVDSGEGSLGKLAADPALYENLERTTRHLHLLLQDFRLNPKRYTRIRLLGKTKNYANPIDDPSYQKMIDSLERAFLQKQVLKK